jgi:hypothetical protein
MTREEIIRLAREAGLENYGPTQSAPYSYGIFVDCVDRFAALVAAHEREACAKLCEEREKANLYGVKECAAAIHARGVGVSE